MAKILLFLLLGFFCCKEGWGQKQKYWVFLKGHCGAYAPEIPASVLAQRPESLKSGVMDLPICPEYQAALRICGFRPLASSRWLNALVLELSEEQKNEIGQLSFVDRIQPVRKLMPMGLPEKLTSQKVLDEVDSEDLSASFWAFGTRQLAMLNADLLQVNHFTGKGIRVAVMDNGFPGVDRLSGFSKTKVVATQDFVSGESDVYNNTGTHGTMVLSTLSAYQPGGLVGAAFDAEYILAVTENDMSESLQEEYNWVMAAEWADSLGADIFTTSLGYTVFDDSTEDHWYQDMDGNTTVITRASDEAARRGILVINSAGNEGNSSWRYISAPADGDSVFAIGSVNSSRQLSSFSSRGPTSDGRIKPDMMAQGERAGILAPDGKIYQYNGTSFSGPIIAGLSAQLMEAFPGVRGYEMGRVIRESGHQAMNPDNDMGYGIPNGEKVYQGLSGKELFKPKQAELMVYPNPARGSFSVSIVFPGEGKDLKMECRDLQGRLVQDFTLDSDHFLNVFSFSATKEWESVTSGIYLLRFVEKDSGQLIGWHRLQWLGK
jgi:serine protease AprX